MTALRAPIRHGHTLRRWAWTLVIFGILTLLVISPIIGLFVASLRTNAGDFTLENYAVLGSARAREAIWNTVIATAGATLGSIIVGGLLAWLIERTDVPAKGFVQIAGVVPMFFSALIGALSWSALGSPNSGYLNTLLTAIGLPPFIDVYSMAGIIFVLTLYYSPFAFLLIRSALSIASGDLENAARMAGASTFQATIRITIPLVMPAIVGAAILVFVIVSANFEVTEILGSFAHLEFLPSFVFGLVNSAQRQIGAAAAIGVVILCVTWIAIWAESRYVLRRSYAAAGGKGARTLLVRLGPWRWVGLGFAVLYILLAAVLPIGALVISAFRPSVFHLGIADLFDPEKYTATRFVEAVASAKFQTGLSNSVILAILTTIVGVTLTFIVAYVARRKSVYGSRYIEYFALAPVAIPGIILGLAFVAVWLRSPIPLYGTIAILVIAFMSQLFPFSFENMSGTLVKLDPELEDGAVMSGAARWRAVVSITVPILRVALGSAALLLFVLSFREFTVALFLYTPRTIPLSIVIYEAWESGTLARMASMALMFVAVLVVAAALNYLVSRRRPENT